MLFKKSTKKTFSKGKKVFSKINGRGRGRDTIGKSVEALAQNRFHLLNNPLKLLSPLLWVSVK